MAVPSIIKWVHVSFKTTSVFGLPGALTSTTFLFSHHQRGIGAMKDHWTTKPHDFEPRWARRLERDCSEWTRFWNPKIPMISMWTSCQSVYLRTLFKPLQLKVRVFWDDISCCCLSSVLLFEWERRWTALNTNILGTTNCVKQPKGQGFLMEFWKALDSDS